MAQQLGMANLFNNPMVMLQLASGFLQPGPNQGSRIGAGLANIAPTMATMMQLQEMTKQQQKQTDMEEALKRMSDPTAAAYTPTPVADGGLSALRAAPANSMTPEQMMAAGQTPASFSMMGDMMKIAPGSVIEAKMKQMTADPNSSQQKLAAAGIRPGTPEAREFLQGLGSAQIRLDNRQESAFEGAEGTRYSSQVFGPLSTAAISSNVQLQKIQRAKDLLANFDSGATAPLAASVANIAQSLGVDPTNWGLDTAGPKEAFAALSNDFTLDAMARLKGVASDSDLKLLKQMQASVGSTPEGNLMILDLAERIESRANAVNDVAQQYLTRSGGKPRGVETAIKEYWAANPLYTPEEAKNINKFIGNARVPNSPEAIKLMSVDDLRKLDVSKFTPQQAAAFRLRMKMLTGN